MAPFCGGRMAHMQITVNGVELFYEQSGAGRPVILLHGNSQDHHSLDRLRGLLASRFTVYAPDSRGHGQSGKVDAFHYGDMAEDVASFIRQLDIEKPILIGHSDGGNIGLLLACQYPDMLGALVACGANRFPAGSKKWFLTFISFANRHLQDPKFEMLLREPDIGPEDLRKIRVPTYILAGSRDLIYENHTREMAAMIPGATCVVLSGQTHTSYLRHPQRLLRVIDPLLLEFRQQGRAAGARTPEHT